MKKRSTWRNLQRRMPRLAAILLWLRDNNDMSGFNIAAWLFMRGIGLVYLAAFVSFALQAQGLIGSHGILPLGEFLARAHDQLGAGAYWQLPMLFWFDASDTAIGAVCWGGAVLALLAVFGILPRISLFLLYVFYLSLFNAGQVFMGFQWDLLMMEAGFLAFVISLAPKQGLWLVRWLLFRFMFLSGSVKLLSGDPSWASLTALFYHFETQPLPTPIAWYVHHFPRDLLVASTGMTFIVELGLPWLIFLSRRFKLVAASGFLLLELLIFLTGNYNFFNLLTMLLCLPLFDDAAFVAGLPKKILTFIERHSPPAKPRRVVTCAANALLALIVFVGSVQIAVTYRIAVPEPAQWVEYTFMPLRIVNAYGLFAVMTVTRPEIIIEGSDDGVHWQEYGFKYKPGDVMRPPLWNIPHQPRLDWQMWFAALGTRYQNPWFTNLMRRLLQNEPDVTALLGDNPFAPPHAPPRFVRAVTYDYTFTTAAERDATGAWWARRPQDIYYPIATLKH